MTTNRPAQQPAPPRLSGVWVAVAVLVVVFVVLLAVTGTLLVVRGGATPGTDPSSPSSAAGSGASPSSTPGPDDLVVPESDGATSFRSPSGNITCVIDAGDPGDAGPGNAGPGDAGPGNAAPSAECEITEVTWSVPEPDDCELDWGGGGEGPGRASIAADGDEAVVVCTGDALAGEAGADPVELAYGRAVWLGDELVCRSSETGMRCESLRTGNGFAVSRAALDLF